ncbi:MAG: DEAD/DEAH box helicase, partial [Pseudomonadota bacterium]
MNASFETFFSYATGSKFAPYPYQLTLANQSWPDIVNIQTGMGKTAGIVLAWLFKRLRKNPETPRRLVYCLPMRVLVEQTAFNAREWIKNLVNDGFVPDDWLQSVYVLMGGEIDEDWDRFPERDAILIGTQDQLLSRALNRGYAMSRFRWPVQFGLLNNDCLWVMDEIQLMGSGLATTTQLEAFRHGFGTAQSVRSIWMSATLQRSWLSTIDFDPLSGNLDELELTDDDKNTPCVNRLFQARKPLEKADCPFEHPKKIAEMVLDAHQKGTRTLVVVNTVRRAMDIYGALKKEKPGSLLTLLHSRFRPPERLHALERILSPPEHDGSICVSTQAVEAGVDVSANTLITDLAP